jgi:hypothetical protein
MSHPDLSAEQAYLDDAYAQLDRMRETLAQAAGAAVGEDRRPMAALRWPIPSTVNRCPSGR